MKMLITVFRGSRVAAGFCGSFLILQKRFVHFFLFFFTKPTQERKIVWKQSTATVTAKVQLLQQLSKFFLNRLKNKKKKCSLYVKVFTQQGALRIKCNRELAKKRARKLCAARFGWNHEWVCVQCNLRLGRTFKTFIAREVRSMRWCFGGKPLRW